MARGRLGTLSEYPQQSEFDFTSKEDVNISEDQFLLSALIALQDLLNIIYIDGNTNALVDPECTTNANVDKPGDGQTAESRTGIRTICVSPDGKHLASGDRNGMLR